MDRETKALLDCLENQRGHVVGILDGLSSEALHQPMLPSGWTSLGLVNHLALDVERFWFRQVVSAETFDLDPDGAQHRRGWFHPTQHLRRFSIATAGRSKRRTP